MKDDLILEFERISYLEDEELLEEIIKVDYPEDLNALSKNSKFCAYDIAMRKYLSNDRDLTDKQRAALEAIYKKYVEMTDCYLNK